MDTYSITLDTTGTFYTINLNQSDCRKIIPSVNYCINELKLKKSKYYLLMQNTRASEVKSILTDFAINVSVSEVITEQSVVEKYAPENYCTTVSYVEKGEIKWIETIFKAIDILKETDNNYLSSPDTLTLSENEGPIGERSDFFATSTGNFIFFNQRYNNIMLVSGLSGKTLKKFEFEPNPVDFYKKYYHPNDDDLKTYISYRKELKNIGEREFTIEKGNIIKDTLFTYVSFRYVLPKVIHGDTAKGIMWDVFALKIPCDLNSCEVFPINYSDAKFNSYAINVSSPLYQLTSGQFLVPILLKNNEEQHGKNIPVFALYNYLNKSICSFDGLHPYFLPEIISDKSLSSGSYVSHISTINYNRYVYFDYCPVISDLNTNKVVYSITDTTYKNYFNTQTALDELKHPASYFNFLGVKMIRQNLFIALLMMKDGKVTLNIINRFDEPELLFEYTFPQSLNNRSIASCNFDGVYFLTTEQEKLQLVRYKFE